MVLLFSPPNLELRTDHLTTDEDIHIYNLHNLLFSPQPSVRGVQARLQDPCRVGVAPRFFRGRVPVLRVRQGVLLQGQIGHARAEALARETVPVRRLRQELRAPDHPRQTPGALLR